MKWEVAGDRGRIRAGRWDGADGRLRRPRRLPGIRQQLGDPTRRVRAHALQHVAEVSPRLHAKGPAALHQAQEHRRGPAPFVAAEVQPVLPIMLSSA